MSTCVWTRARAIARVSWHGLYMSVYIANFLRGNVIEIRHVGELEIHTVLTYHCANYSVWSGPSLTVLYLVFTAKT